MDFMKMMQDFLPGDGGRFGGRNPLLSKAPFRS
jgi:hypothetical protein